jgi:outer membrane protein assembly factor BamB
MAEPPEEPPEEPPDEPPVEPPVGPLFEPPEEPPDEPVEPVEPLFGRPEEPPDEPVEPLFGRPEEPPHEPSEEWPHEQSEEWPHEPPEVWLEDSEVLRTPEELAQRRAEERAQRRRVGQQRLLALIIGVVGLIVVIVVVTGLGGGGNKPTSTITLPTTTPAAQAGKGPSYLAVGLANSTVVPANILIADRNNNRLLVVSPKGQVVWQLSEPTPSDAYFSSTGRSIVVTQHLKAVVLRRSVTTGKITYSYGHAGSVGSGSDRLHDPQTGHQIGGQIVIADLGNCRVLFVAPPSHRRVTSLGSGQCVHHPPTSFAQPDAVFPTADGGLVVTERNPGWIDLLSKTHTVTKTIRLLTFAQPYDANESKYVAGQLIVTDHTRPGAVEELDAATGKVTWTYSVKSGGGELNLPTLARALPNGDVLVADSGNDRVIVIDAKTKQIVWQYGHTAKPSSANGFLHTPDSVDLVP